MKSIHRFSIVIMILCLLFILGCASDKKPSAQAEIKPQNIKICSTLGKNITELLVKDFVKQSKVKIIPTIEYVPGGTLEQRLAYIEKGNFDCWLGGTAEEYYTANGHKLLAPYNINVHPGLVIEQGSSFYNSQPYYLLPEIMDTDITKDVYSNLRTKYIRKKK